MTGPDRRRGGAIIKEIRDASGANLKILTPDELPPCALANDRVVQCARCSLSPATFGQAVQAVDIQNRDMIF